MPNDKPAAPAPETPAPETPPRPLTDADVMVGFPSGIGENKQDPPPSAPDKGDPPKTTEVTIKGKKYSVSPDVAEALDDYRRDIQERDGRRGGELDQLRRQLQNLETKITSKPDPKDEKPKLQAPKRPPAELALTDPVKYDELMDKYESDRDAYRDAQIQERYLEDQQRRNSEATRNTEWSQAVDRFYKDNPELVGLEDLVDATWKSNFNTLKDMTLSEGFAELAKIVRKRVLTLTGKTKDNTPDGTERPAAVEPGRSRQQVPSANPDNTPSTLTAVIKARQARMRAAAARKPAQK